MPVYAYVATNRYGQRTKGTLEALDEREVVLYLKTQGMTAERVRPSLAKFELSFGSGVKSRELMTFTRMLATLNRATVPLDAALAALYKQAETTAMRRVIKRISIEVEGGSSFADACRAQPKVFDTIFSNMIAAGEASGHMATLLERLAEMMERNDAIRTKVRGAMIYPIALGFFAIGAVIILLTFVLPQFISMFESSKVPLPLPTRITIGASHALQEYWLYMLIAVVGMVYATRTALKRPHIRRMRDAVLLKLPVFGGLIRKAAVSRFALTMSTLLNAGVTIVSALELVSGTTGNILIAEAISTTRRALSMGGELAPTMEETKVFPPMVVSMVSVGEATGGMEEMLSRVAEYFDNDVNRTVDGAIKLIEPIMLAIFGVLIGVILMSIYLPMFSMLSVLSGPSGS